MPLSVSTIIPTFNRAHLIRRAIDSVLAQQPAWDEVIVVDDGSTDETARVLSEYRSRVRYVRTDNRGAGAARNRGLREASRDLVAFLDSDDEWMPHKLTLARRWLEARSDVLFVFSDFAVTDAHNRASRRYLIEWHNDPRPWDEILGPAIRYSTVAPLPDGITDFAVHVGSLYEREFERPYVLTSSLVARRAEAGEALQFCEDVPTMEDLECFGRLSRRGRAAFFDTETVWQHGQATDRLSGMNELRRTAANLTVLARVWGADGEFLARHGADYRRVVDNLRLRRARILILQGRMPEARDELRSMTSRPLGHMLIASVPASVVRAVRAGWMRVRGRIPGPTDSRCTPETGRR